MASSTKVTKTTKTTKTGSKPARSQKLENKIKSAKRLIETCEKAIFNGGYGTFTIRGVENLSREDVNNIIEYCEYFIANKSVGGLMPPCGGVGEVLSKIEICESQEGWLL